ncbi:MAG: endonuclease [Nevskia sp.]|nr:endonuclease [Nevskia sp.]
MRHTAIRLCFREPIPEIAEAARLLDDAVSAHLSGDVKAAEQLLLEANMPVIRAWLDSIWGANSPYVQYRVVPNAHPVIPNEGRIKVRMPSAEEKQRLHQRDGFHCRFCGMPVIRKEIRQRIAKAYPDALQWGRQNITQHAAFQSMWAQYDHIVPHARGGTNDLNNVVVTCAACNFGRMNYLLEEVGLSDPRLREPIRSSWDGLERFRAIPLRKPTRGKDQASVVGRDGIEINSFLYEVVEKEDTEEMRAAHRRWLIKIGLSEEEAKRVS